MRLEAFLKKNLVKAQKIINDSVMNQLVLQVSSLKTLMRDHAVIRISQIKEQLQAMKEEVNNAEVVMATLNGLPGSWNSFIQGMCSKRK